MMVSATNIGTIHCNQPTRSLLCRGDFGQMAEGECVHKGSGAKEKRVARSGDDQAPTVTPIFLSARHCQAMVGVGYSRTQKYSYTPCNGSSWPAYTPVL